MEIKPEHRRDSYPEGEKGDAEHMAELRKSNREHAIKTHSQAQKDPKPDLDDAVADFAVSLCSFAEKMAERTYHPDDWEKMNREQRLSFKTKVLLEELAERFMTEEDELLSIIVNQSLDNYDDDAMFQD